MTETCRLSCADCSVNACNKGLVPEAPYPEFCVTDKLTQAEIDEILKLYTEDEENARITRASAEVECDYYCRMTRVEEFMKVAEKMGAVKIGIATCIGLIRETKVLARILRYHGFEVYCIACKAGAVPKVQAGIDPHCEAVGVNMCNPIMQAHLLNEYGTDYNVVMGLCVGHDSLFYKYSEAPVTTLVAKDRVLGHNPAAALYTADSYYAKKLYPQDSNQKEQ